ncbi:MAG: histidinol dehydrogenase, partial [Sphingomonadales bacterium]|nr:histidinol dehydrogenase [Sphingomonadales bacterium]
MPLRLNAGAPGFEAEFSRFVAAKREAETDVRDAVAGIVADVRARGDDALFELTERFDRVDLREKGLAIGRDEIAAARQKCSAEALAALETAAERITAFHEMGMPENLTYRDEAGVTLGYRWTPIEAVGLYVPGGLASYPSSVLMNGIPAKVAGVGRVAMVVPCPDGEVNPLVLAAADIAGIAEIYAVGGAQAIAALAYGTETIAAVDKVFGPGNAYVAEAKRQVFGVVGIDMIAGPSEILVVADAENDPAWIA